MGCSALNSHLSLILHVQDNPGCASGKKIESPSHFFLHCPFYHGQRKKLVNNIRKYTDCNINVILFGDKNLTFEENKAIFKFVHIYIKNSNRFVAGGIHGR